MAASNQSGDFLSRFDAIVRAYRRVSVLRAVCWALLIVLLAFAAITAVDYFFELRRGVRLVATSAIFAFAAAALVALAYRVLRRATGEAVAAELEHHFPQFGQAVRTAVQYRTESAMTGASQALVNAMNHDLAARSTELPLDEAVPSRAARRAGLAVAGGVILLVILAASSWEWRTATLRALFGGQPYTQVAASPGDTLVEEGASLRVAAEVRGRARRPMTLMTRTPGSGEASWTTQELSEVNVIDRATRLVKYEVDVPNVREPLEYRIAAGPYVTPVHHVAVRHPLEIESIRVEVTPPEYTGLSTTVVDEGSLRAVAGSKARFQITLDRPAETASMMLSSSNRRRGEEAQDVVVPLVVDGKTLAAELDLTDDVLYSVEGLAADGSRIRKNRHRIRVRDDRPPRISFDEPHSETEVHSLAEVVLRARVEDDFGITRAGIVFQVNNGQEYPLVLRDVASEQPDEPSGGAEKNKSGGLQSVTNMELEKILPLEHFELTQKDSITYYAFAEDNVPGGPRRAQTDLQFIDIRPFRRLYRAAQGGFGGGGGGGGGPQLASLEELISRERFILNRTLRIARAVANGQGLDLGDVDQIISLQQETAELTRELADSVAQFEDEIGVTEERVSDLFYSAEEAMLTVMDSLSVGGYETASLQERDALRYLVEGRNLIEITIGQGGGGGALRRLFEANRRLLQRLRRPRTDIERAAEAARTLRTLADREQNVYDALAEMRRDNMEADAQDDDLDPETAEMRRDIEERQLDIGLDVERVDEVIQDIEGMTELVRERSTNSVGLAAAVSSAMGRGNTGEAADEAQSAAALFGELAVQIDGVTALEPAGRMARARDVASRMAVDFRAMGDEVEQKLTSWNSAADDQAPAVATDQLQTAETLSRRAARLADSAATIEDVLSSILQSFTAEQDEAVARIGQLIAESNLDDAAQQIRRLENTLASRNWDEFELETDALADRMDNLAQRLDTIHRSLVAPRIEQLRALELRAVELLELLMALPGDSHVTRWHEKAEALLEDLAAAEVSLESASQLSEVMEAAGWSGRPPANWGWPAVGPNNLLEPPSGHVAATQALVAAIQRYIQELVIGGIYAADADAVPPEYVPLVRRYLEALAKDTSN
jgi:hypothetical protein